MSYTTEQLFVALQGIIGNMPRHATEIDIHLEPRSMATMRVVSEVLEAGSPVIEGDQIKTELRMFAIVPFDLLVAARNLVDAGPADKPDVAELREQVNIALGRNL